MNKDSVAYKMLWPTDTKIVVRVCFLYVGQGSSILVLVRDGKDYRGFLADVNMDKKNGGIDVPKMLEALLPDGKLRGFINTHGGRRRARPARHSARRSPRGARPTPRRG